MAEQPFFLSIDGQAETAAARFEVINPATEAVVATAPDASREQLDRAVAAARRAFPDWRDTPIDERKEALYRFADAIERDIDGLASWLTLEQGKPLRAARDEVSRAAAICRGICDNLIPVQTLRDDGRSRIVLEYRPLGVVAAITPWNVPVVLALSKIASALYTGNTIVLKPSPNTPLTSLLLGELGRDLFPAGVLNILSGGNELGAWMTAHPDVDKISFTGSGPTGKKILKSGAETLKRVTLELGGNDAAIVLDDANPAEVVPGLFGCGFTNSGQICAAIKRLYVHDSLHDAVVEGLVEQAGKAVLGDGLDPATTLGPVQNRMQYDKVVDLIESARAAGATFACGGEIPDRAGYFIPPTIVTGLTDGARLVDEEQFGPVLPVIRFTDVGEVIERANATRFGLTGSIWTSNVERGEQLARRLEAGTVSVNRHLGTDPHIPFGGCKESGLGREYGTAGLLGYMEPRVVYSALS